ncbi:Dihydroorotase [hydrothermal vent metagenome]|uniref:dihydroorotase n=1 Tax=hydrothermal vent metagenome TaxID=652676 RepID=A0A3B1ASQ9_9ZZZZ
MVSLTITQPDDWHLHVRDGEALTDIMAETTRCFSRAIIMPNLKPPVTTTQQAKAYRQRILNAIPNDCDFTPLMTLYLTDQTKPDEISKARESGFVQAVKYYPAGATTNSDSGVTDIKKTYPALQALSDHNMPLLIHGEVTDPDSDIFEREAIFIEQVLKFIIQDFPDLKIVFEHITTKQAVDFVLAQSDNIAATITPHHLLYNRNAMFKGGIRPHYYCLPVLKHEQHRLALNNAATSGNPKFFLGTDSAPHAVAKKESSCGCAGIYNAPVAIELYATIFEQAGQLDRLEGFASLYGPKFYNLPVNVQKLTLEKESWTVPNQKSLANETIIPLCSGEQLDWKIKI